MTKETQVSPSGLAKRALSVAVATTLAFVSVLGIGPSAHAQEEMTPVINFDGNILASGFVHSQKGERLEQYQVALDSAPLKNVLTTTRAGYSFGGWSYTAGGPAVTTLQTASHTSTRVALYAVWNTKLSLDTNGATSGRLVGGETTVDYRFSQDLVLPSGGTIKKKGYSFGGWTLAADSGVVTSTYRAAPTAVGNPTVYAAWKKTISFKSRGSVGAVPAPITVFEGGARASLPTASQITLTRTGFTFMGWSTTPRGKAIKNSASYLPKTASITLHAVWKKN
jgi:hypothetical protein